LLEDRRHLRLGIETRHPSVDDVSPIVRRIQAVEAVGPNPMDEVDADAFREA
jgi:hypothetical protein